MLQVIARPTGCSATVYEYMISLHWSKYDYEPYLSFMRKKCLLYSCYLHITWLSISLFSIMPIMHFSNDARIFCENIYKKISMKINFFLEYWEWKKREGERGLECHLWNNWDFFSKFIWFIIFRNFKRSTSVLDSAPWH